MHEGFTRAYRSATRRNLSQFNAAASTLHPPQNFINPGDYICQCDKWSKNATVENYRHSLCQATIS